MALKKAREKFGNTDPDVILPVLPKSILSKKLREYFEDIGVDLDVDSLLPSTSKHVRDQDTHSPQIPELPSQSSPQESNGSAESEHGFDSNKKSPPPSTTSDDLKSESGIQPQPSPDSTSSKLIDYRIQYKLREFSVVCGVLPQELIEKATKGKLDWKVFFNSGQIVDRKATSAKKLATGKRTAPKKQFESFVEFDDQDVQSSSHGSSSDDDYTDDDRKKSKKLKGRRKRRLSGEIIPVKLPSFKCSVCKIAFRAQKSLDKHFASAHKSVGDPIQCPLCDTISTNPTDHAIHKYEVHEGPKELEWHHNITCKSCPGQVFKKYVDFDNHVINHVEAKESGYACAICGWLSDKYQSVQIHSKTHIQFKCTFCDKMFHKLKLIESISHKMFGRPFMCSLCDFRSSVYSLLEEHKESRHAVRRSDSPGNENQESCLLCGESNFIFSSRETTLDHLSQHAKIHLYKCIACDYTGETKQLFDDHFIETHISLMIEHDVYCEETNVEIIMDKIAVLVKKKVSNERLRNRPNLFETQSAVAAILDDSAAENSSFGDPSDRYFDFVERLEENDRKKKKSKKRSSEVYSDMSMEVTNSGRPKRKSFVDAQMKLSASTIKKEDSDTEDEDMSQDFVEVPSKKVKTKLEPDLRFGIPNFTETNCALDTLNTSLDGTNVINYIPEEITSPSRNQEINTQLTQQYLTISQTSATGEEGDNETDEDEDYDPDLQFNSLGQIVNTIQPGCDATAFKKKSKRKTPQMQIENTWQGYDPGVADPTSLTPFGPSSCEQEIPPLTYYNADTKTLVINGVPVYDAQGNVAQVEPQEVDQVFALYASQYGGNGTSEQFSGY